MDIITTPQEMTSWSRARIIENKKIALVPTMGFFHEGHLSLMRKARELADLVVVSLFVNPIQFGPKEDLDKYPRGFERDSSLAKETGVDMLFAPGPEHMYQDDAMTRVTVSGLTEHLCGKSRPGHFQGVTTVVAKLFNIVLPHVAVFGKKDFQQLAVIRQMVRDLNWDIAIYGHPIVREADGLAMSSRNTYLTVAERKSALSLRNAIFLARKKVRQGIKDTKELTRLLGDFINSFENVTLEYADIVNKNTLEIQDKVDNQSVLALAAKVGKTRLIDNDELFEGE